MAYSALYNPISINIDDINRVHDSTERNKYPFGTIIDFESFEIPNRLIQLKQDE